MKHKLICILLTLFLINFISACTVLANDELLNKQFDNLDTSELNEFLKELNTTYEEYLPEYDLKDFIGFYKKNKAFNVKDLITGIVKYVFREITTNFNILGELIALAIICAVLRNAQYAFGNNKIGDVAYGIVNLVLVIIAIHSFTVALKIGKDAIDQMVTFVQALLPVIFTLLASIGGITSVAVFNPLVFVGVTAASTWIKDIILPIIYFTAVLGVINNISDRFKVTSLASFLKQICVFLLGLFLSVFIGILVVQGAASATVDGITIKTAKFASKNFIPIVGGFFSDAVDTVVGCSLILKNAIGFAGLIIVFLLTIFPVIKILSIMFVYKLAGAIIQPVGEDSIVKCLNDIGNSLSMIFISVASVALMFFIAITVILSAGNITVMMR